MKSITADMYRLMKGHTRSSCPGPHNGRGMRELGFEGIWRQMVMDGYLDLWECNMCKDFGHHLALTALGKEAMMCYEFATKVMDLGLT